MQKTHISILHDILDTISYTLDLDTVLQEVIRVVDSVAEADEIFVYLLEGEALRIRAAKHERPELYASVSLPIGEGITGWVAKNQKQVYLEQEAYKDERFFVIDELDADNFEAFLSIPLVYRGELIGVFNVQHKQPHTYSEEELGLLAVIAKATAGAIRTAQLFEQNVALEEALEARKVIDQAKGRLMASMDLSEKEAYDWLKKRSMDLRKSMKEVAEAVLISIA